MGFWSFYDRTKLWDELESLEEKVDFLLRKVKTLEMKMKEHGIQ